VSDVTPQNRRRWYWLLLLPCIAAVWVPFYNTVEPRFAGVPFFYWYQLLLVLITASLTALVYFKAEHR
jgi:hypothetical protein